LGLTLQQNHNLHALQRANLKIYYEAFCLILNLQGCKQKYSIPIACHSIFDKLRQFIENNKCKLKIKSKTVKSIGNALKLPEKYKIIDNLGIDTYRLNDGYYVKKMKIKHPDTEINKLIIANKCSLTGSLIDTGKLGLVGSDKTYITGSNLTILQKFLNTKLCSLIGHLTKYRQDFLDKEAFTYIPDVRIIKNFDIDKVYNIFRFDKDEIKIIENFK